MAAARTPQIDPSLAAHAYRTSRAGEWGLSIDAFAAAIAASVAHASAAAPMTPRDIQQYVAALHVEDVALATACAAGLERAWDQFVREYRPLLYRAADAIDPSGGAREIADALYADLFGLTTRSGARQSLFRYFHGRSRLQTWLSAVLAQRVVDRARHERRFDPMPDGDPPAAAPSAVETDPERPRFAAAMSRALAAAVAALAPRDRLRLACYYAQNLTLAAIGRLLGEHEATASRHLARTRQAIADDVRARLRREYGFDDAAIEECFRSMTADAGTLDLADLVGAAADGKIGAVDRSK